MTYLNTTEKDTRNYKSTTHFNRKLSLSREEKFNLTINPKLYVHGKEKRETTLASKKKKRHWKVLLLKLWCNTLFSRPCNIHGCMWIV